MWADSISERESTLRDLIASARQTIDDARAELRALGAEDELAEERQKRAETVERVLEAACEDYGVTRADLVRRGPGSRVAWISRARQAAMLRLREQALLSVVEIGALLDRHHATVIYGIEQAKRTRRELAEQPEQRPDVRADEGNDNRKDGEC